jgi:hypothetical protein
MTRRGALCRQQSPRHPFGRTSIQGSFHSSYHPEITPASSRKMNSAGPSPARSPTITPRPQSRQSSLSRPPSRNSQRGTPIGEGAERVVSAELPEGPFVDANSPVSKGPRTRRQGSAVGEAYEVRSLGKSVRRQVHKFFCLLGSTPGRHAQQHVLDLLPSRAWEHNSLSEMLGCPSVTVVEMHCCMHAQ